MATVGHLGGFALHRQIEPAFLTRIGGFILVGETALPKDIEAKMAVEDMILELATEGLVRGDLVIGPPEVTDQFNRNTRIEVTWPGNPVVEGSVYFYYNRVGVGELKLPPGFALQEETSSYQLLPRVRSVTGIWIVEDDFVDLPQGNGVTMRAAASSYFFIPGSQIIVGGTESA